MEIRKFIFSIVTKYDDSGNKRARRDTKEAAKEAERAARSWSRLGDAQKSAARSATVLARAEDRAGNEAKKAGRDVQQAGRRTRRASIDFKEFGGSISKLAPLAGAAGKALAGLATIGAGVAAGVIHTGTSFESLRARLKTVEGSVEGANKAFAQIQDFTKTTPFQLEEVTTAFVRLKSLGLDASKESLTAFGNLSAAQGKSIIDFIEAVADASTGEFERLKEFGIKASSEGDRVAFTFKGQTTTVGKNAKEIQDFLRGLGETEFAGAMDDQMATAAGAISNLRDQIATFFDEVAQLGVLDEFKALLKDLSGLAGDEEGGFAKILADALVRAIRAVRQALSQITAQDIEEVLRAGVEAAKTFASVLGFLADALRLVADISGGADKAIVNMTLAVVALTAAFSGPAGLVVAAGAIGAVIGNLLNEFLGASDAVEGLLERITGLKKELADLEKEGRGKRGAPELEGGPITQERTFDLVEAAEGAARKRAQELGISEEGTEFFVARERERVLEATGGVRLATTAGARDIALGQGVAAEASAETAASLQTAAEFALGLGELEAAAEQTIAEQAGGGGPPKRGKKGKQFFDFQKQAEQAARQQGEKFAQETLEQLRSEGVAVEVALAQARQAGRDRAAELEKRFLEAGRIFDASADNVLDILGLRGPGSVLEGRPPPQNLTIAPQMNFTMIGEFTQTIESVAGAAALTEITGRAGEAAAAAGFTDTEARLRAIVEAMFSLKINQLMKADAGGKLPQGPQG